MQRLRLRRTRTGLLGDHFEVDKALDKDDYCAKKRELLEKNNLQVFAISNHLVGQAVSDNIDALHKAILPPYIWGNGSPAEVNARAAENMIDRPGPRRNWAWAWSTASPARASGPCCIRCRFRPR